MPWISYHDGWSLLASGGSCTALDGFHEINGRAGIETLLTADDAVGEDAEVLVALADVDDGTLGGREVRGDKDGDVGGGFGGVKWEAESLEADGVETVEDFVADACL